MSIYLEIGFLVAMYMSCWFLIAQLLRDNGIVDIAWGLGFVTVVSYVFITKEMDGPYFPLFFVTILWGIRLALYILIRRLHEKKEDWRYKKWREDWGKSYIIQAFFKVFMTQGAFMFIISLPLIQTNSSTDIDPIQYVGIIFALFGIVWEGLADWQLFQFKKESKNKGKIIQTGVWKYSRHPNYFGEMMVWWSIFIIALPFGNWWISIISPITICSVLIFISTPMLEKQMKKKPNYEQYVQDSNRFLPKF